MALMETGSNTTLGRYDVIPVRATVEPTLVQLKIVTSDLAPIQGRRDFLFTVGDLSVYFTAWVAEVQDPCILGLDFLRTIGCVLALGRGCLYLVYS